MEFQQLILDFVAQFFPHCDVLYSYSREADLHILEMILESPNATFEVAAPKGFIITNFRVKNGRHVIFNLMIHSAIFQELYNPALMQRKNARPVCYA